MARLPLELLAAFRSAETVADIGVLLAEDGFDAITMRVFAAWANSENRWKQPKKPRPDDGRPTATAWRWICDHWTIDIAAIAAGAGVSPDVARERIAILKHARLIFPDGEPSKFAKQALTTTIAQRLRAGAGKRSKKSDDSPAN